MIDIVARLRRIADMKSGLDRDRDLLNEAADQIERLRTREARIMELQDRNQELREHIARLTQERDALFKT